MKKNTGKMSRRKGHNFEREIAAALRCVFPAARRHLEYQDAEANGVDLAHTAHYRVQCKRGRRYASFTAIEEIEYDHLLGEVPVLVTRADDKPALVALPLEEFLRLLVQVRGA